MRLFHIAFCVCLCAAGTYAQTAAGEQGGTKKGDNEPRLQLTTSITSRRCTREVGTTFTRLTLKLTYTNFGQQPIFLDRKSSLLHRSMISRSLEKAASKKYVEDTTSSYFDLSKAGFRVEDTPQEDAFILLKAGESYSLEKDGYGIQLYDGTKDGEDYLRPGKYFLQFDVTTWYYTIPPEMYREQWRNKGYLWSEKVTSAPMPFIIKKAECEFSR